MKLIFLFSFCLFLSFYPAQPAPVLESGVKATPQAQAAIDKMKLGKDFRYAIFLVENEKEIALESTGSRTATYDEYLPKLKASGCRYGLFDMEVPCQSSSQKKNKLVLTSWCPDTAKVRSKFIHAASVEGMKKAAIGYSVFIQASDDEEASLKTVQTKIASTVTAC